MGGGMTIAMERSNNFLRLVLCKTATGRKSLRLLSILLLIVFTVSPLWAASSRTLTLLYFGCQDGFLKPCG